MQHHHPHARLTTHGRARLLHTELMVPQAGWSTAAVARDPHSAGHQSPNTRLQAM